MSCNKISYASEHEAKKEAVFIRKIIRNSKNMHKNKTALFPYLCRFCGKWHLTSAKRFKKYSATQKAKFRKINKDK